MEKVNGTDHIGTPSPQASPFSTAENPTGPQDQHVQVNNSDVKTLSNAITSKLAEIDEGVGLDLAVDGV